MNLRLLAAVASAAALPLGVCRADGSFTPDDVHLWVGAGTNRMVLVIDWNHDRSVSSKAWGYRWNGPAPDLATVLRRVALEDHRLSVFCSDGCVKALAYDADDDGGVFDPESKTQTDEDDFFAVDGWTLRHGNSGERFADVVWNPVPADPAIYHPANGAWAVLLRGEGAASEPIPADTPYGFAVVASDVVPGPYGNVEAALGRPATLNPGWDAFPATPIVPCSPAWEASALVTLETASDEDVGGSITIAFDHPVRDDPANPFGLDFIVFGNAFHTLGGSEFWTGTEDPATVRFASDTLAAEPGLVEVSQDGETWFAFSDGPWADGFAPTISHLYDTNAPDASLFGDYAVTNRWWGELADATKPVDPALSSADFFGHSLAECVRLYNGSAGGTGFDIADFDLPVDAQGRKWIRFVRITTREPGDETDIDAVSDVAPAPAFDNWVRRHYDAERVPDIRASTRGPNGRTALECAARNLAPGEEPTADFAVTSFSFESGWPVLDAGLAEVPDLAWLECAAAPTGPWTHVLPVWHGTRLWVPTNAPGSFFRVVLRHD